MPFSCSDTTVGRAFKRGFAKIHRRHVSEHAKPLHELEQPSPPWLRTRRFASTPNLRDQTSASSSSAPLPPQNHTRSTVHLDHTATDHLISKTSHRSRTSFKQRRSQRPPSRSSLSTCSVYSDATATGIHGKPRSISVKGNRRSARASANRSPFDAISQSPPIVPRRSSPTSAKDLDSIHLLGVVPAPMGVALCGSLPRPSRPGWITALLYGLFKPFALIVSIDIRTVTLVQVASFSKTAFDSHPGLTVRVCVGSTLTEESIVRKDAALRQYLLRGPELPRLELRIIPSYVNLLGARSSLSSMLPELPTVTSQSAFPVAGFDCSEEWRMPESAKSLFLDVADKPTDKYVRRCTGFKHPERIVRATEKLLGHVDDHGRRTSSYDHEAVVRFIGRYEPAQLWGILGFAAETLLPPPKV